MEQSVQLTMFIHGYIDLYICAIEVENIIETKIASWFSLGM